ncbi:MAG: hypothetical protein WB586_10755 [Chthoniobacterales bacterium]
MTSPGRLSNAHRFVNRLGAVWIAVMLLYLVSSLISPGMFQIGETLNILQVSAFLGIVAIGQTPALLVGGIDLSVAKVVTMSNIVVTSLMVGRSDTLAPALVISVLLAAYRASARHASRSHVGKELDLVRRRIGLYRRYLANL